MKMTKKIDRHSRKQLTTLTYRTICKLTLGTLISITALVMAGCFSSGDTPQPNPSPNPSPNPQPSPTPNPTPTPKPPTQGEPIKYDTQAWSPDALDFIGFTDVSVLVNQVEEELTNTLGKMTSQKLDNQGSNSKTTYTLNKDKYDYAIFEVVDSQQTLELQWYYANVNDNDMAKQISTEYAKTAHKIARQSLGKLGGEAVIDLISGNLSDKGLSAVQERGQLILGGSCTQAFCSISFAKEQSF